MFKESMASIPSFLAAFSHDELLSRLASGLATLDTSVAACSYPCTFPAQLFPLSLPPFHQPFCCSSTPTPLLTSSPTSRPHRDGILTAAASTSAAVMAEVEEQKTSALKSPLSRSSKFKESVEGKIALDGDPKRYRTTYSPYQSRVLEEVFQIERYISRPQRAQLATQLKLPENTIKVWFQNRRMKEKRQSMMLPSVAGNDPYLRETLLHVAKLYCDYQQKQGTTVEVGVKRSCDESTSPVEDQRMVKYESSQSTCSPSPPPVPSTSTSASASASSFNVDNLCPPRPTARSENLHIIRPF